MRGAWRVCGGFAAALALAVSACSGPIQPSGDGETAIVPASVARSPGDNRFYDPAASGDLLQVLLAEYDEFDDFAREVDLVFTGRIVDTKRDFAILGPSTDFPDGVQLTYDGIVFEIEDILSGEERDESGLVTIAHPVLQRVIVDDEFQHWPISLEPIALVRDGVERSEFGEQSPLYLVFAEEQGFNDGPRELVFTGPGSVALIEEGTGKVLPTDSPPFNLVQLRYGRVATVDYVRELIDDGPPLAVVSDEDKKEASELTVPVGQRTESTGG